ncbi:hypothetical protein ACOMHN_025437 [Nucella lapillus]
MCNGVQKQSSHNGLGAILSQEQDGKRRVVAYASRRLRPTEKNKTNYSSMKLEFLAMKWAFAEKFRDYLLGSRFTVLTDNNPLVHFRTAPLGALEQSGMLRQSAFLTQLLEKLDSNPQQVEADMNTIRQHTLRRLQGGAT